MAFLQSLEKWFVKIIEVFCIVVIAVMVLLVGAQAIMRFILANKVDMSWSEEAVRFLLCYMVFFGTVLVYEKHGHVWVSNLVDAVPVSVRKILLTLSYLVQLAFCICVFLGTARYMPVVKTQFSNVLHIPLNYVYMIIPVTIAFTMVFCVRDLIMLLMGKGDLKPEKPTVPVPEEGGMEDG